MMTPLDPGKTVRLRNPRTGRPEIWSALRRALAIPVLAVIAVITVACGNDPAAPSSQPTGTYRVTNVTVNGHSIPCITWKDGYAGGLSCDWTAR